MNKVNPLWVLVAMCGGYVVYQEYEKRATPPADHSAPSAPDPVAVKLGADYRAAFAAAGLATLDTIAGETFVSTADIAAAQREALDKGLKSAWSPIAAELTKRFGVTSAGGDDPKGAIRTAADARVFYRDVATGWRKAK